MLTEFKDCFGSSFAPPTCQENSKRIEFIDLAKGICILMVVLYHFSERWFNIPNLASLRMPLYFTLSGLFFKSYGDINGFSIKKINNILIPYLFWFIIGIVIAICLDYDGLKECESYREWQDQNVPIWFLLCLFNANLLFYLLQYYFKNYVLFIAVCIISMIGIFCKINDVGHFLELREVCWFFPFFYMGYMLKDVLVNIQSQSHVKSFLLGVAAITFSYFIFYLTKYSGIELLTGNNVFNKVLSIANSAFYVMGFLLLCKIVRWLPVISYIGRYSIIVLCTHWLIMRLLYAISGGPVENVILKFVFLASLLFCCWIAIPICKRYLPYFVAQKPLLKLK